MAQAATFRLNPAVAIEDFGDRSLVLDCERLRMVELNATARIMVTWLEDGLSPDEMVARLAQQYGQPAEQIRQDVESAIARMLALGILEPRGQV